MVGRGHRWAGGRDGVVARGLRRHGRRARRHADARRRRGRLRVGPARCAAGAPHPRLPRADPRDPPRPLPRRARRPARGRRERGEHHAAAVPPDAPGYDRDAADLQVLSCRRTTLEWVLRRCALAEPSVRFEVGVAVAGLLAADAAPDRSTSAACASTTAASCRPTWSWRAPVGATPCPAWFAEHGVTVAEEEHPTGTIYLSRFYRAPPATTRRWATRAGGAPGSGSWWPAPTTAPTRPPSRWTPTTPSSAPTSWTPTATRRCSRCSARWSRSSRRGGEPITPVQAMGGLDQPHPPLPRRRRRAARPRLLRHRRRPHVHEPALRPRLVARGAPGGPRRRRPRRAPCRPRRRRPRLRGGQRRQGRALVRRVAAHRPGRPRAPTPTAAGRPPPPTPSTRARPASTSPPCAASRRRAIPSCRCSSPRR